MFVDCPDELGSFDGRNADVKEETDARERRPDFEEEEDRGSHFGGLDNGGGDELVVKRVAKRESNTWEYKVWLIRLTLDFAGAVCLFLD